MKIKFVICLGIVSVASNCYPYSYDELKHSCSEKIFSTTFAGDVNSLIAPNCYSKSGTNRAYQLALNYFQSGVLFACGYLIPMLQGSLDAETKFKLSALSSTKMKEALLNCQRRGAEGLQKITSTLPECINSDLTTKLLEAGKFCGDGMGQVMNGDEYKETYKALCLLKKKEKECTRLSELANVDFLQKAGSGDYLN